MFEDAELFIHVAENRSFSKAATKLKLSAPIVTRRIAKLERQLDTRLLQRNTRQVSLTDAGQVFYESCKKTLQDYSNTIKQLKSLNNEVSGTIKIGLPNSISHLYITQCLNQFIKKYPDLKIDIVNGNHLIDLLSSGFDLIIHCGKLADSNFYCRKLGEWKKITCASAHYLKRFGTPKYPDDLRKHNCIDHYDNVDNCWEYIIDNKIQSIPINGNIRINSSLDLKNIAVSGLGIAYLPSFTVKKELNNGILKNLLTSYQMPSLLMYAVYPSNRFLSKKMSVFLDFLSKLDI